MKKTQTMFKMENPMDLVSRMFILEYVRDLGVDIFSKKLTEGEAKFWLYKFETDEGVEYDFNWEYLMFVIPLGNLGKIMEKFLEEIEVVDAQKQVLYNKRREELFQKELNEPVDINIMDLARSEIKRTNEGPGLILPNN